MFTLLAYEVIWVRELSFVFGTTVYALSSAIAAILAGLALGAFIAGRYLPKLTRLWRVFAKAHFTVAVYSLMLMLVVFPLLSYLYSPIYSQFYSNPLLFTASMFLLSFLILIVPSAMLGAAFPLAAAIYPHENTEVRAAKVYAADTLGAGLGAFIAGFVLLPNIGLAGSTFATIAINLLVGILAWNFREPGTESRQPPAEHPSVSQN